jgi:hypothetical protein
MPGACSSYLWQGPVTGQTIQFLHYIFETLIFCDMLYNAYVYLSHPQEIFGNVSFVSSAAA